MSTQLKRILSWSLGGLMLLLLQGCLLTYFFAPKTTAGELPSDPRMEALRTAYITQCGRCHLLVAPRYFDREHPIDSYVSRYVGAKLLTRREADEAAAYIRILTANIGAEPASVGPTPVQAPVQTPEPIPTAPPSEASSQPIPPSPGEAPGAAAGDATDSPLP